MTEHPGGPRRGRLRLTGHPPGLWVLAGTEFWDRVSFHGMQALLVLYMAGWLLLPGHVDGIAGFAAYRAGVEAVTGPLSVQALAAQTFGLYIGLIYFAPILGGALGDRYVPRRVAVAGGALLMALGHFALAFDRAFLAALLLLILGAGLLRGNLSTQVKALYADGDPREADAFQLYYVAINIGAFIAPILTGGLAALYGWHSGFALAGIGMLAGLLLYLRGLRHLPPDPPRRRIAAAPLAPDERRRVRGLLLLTVPLLGFWIAQTQVWNVYNLWVRDHVTLGIGRFQVPIPWLQALDGVAPILVMPLFLTLWQRQRAAGREPDDLAKMAIGCLIFAAGTAWLALSGLVAAPDGRAPLLWAVAFHLISNSGWLYVVPIAVALYAAKAPSRLRGTMLGVNNLTVFAASVLSGRIGGLYETMTPAAFWWLHAAIVGAGGVTLWLGGPMLRRSLSGASAPQDIPAQYPARQVSEGKAS